MRRRRRNLKPAQGECRHCDRFFTYFLITKRRKFCTSSCAVKFGNDYFNGLTSQARREEKQIA